MSGIDTIKFSVDECGGCGGMDILLGNDTFGEDCCESPPLCIVSMAAPAHMLRILK